MRDRLLRHYEQELRFLRRMATEFAEAHPDVAAGLQIDPTRCDDPHVERMIEACAMMAARVQLRLDDDFSEVSEALLSILYPHYLAPVPSIALVQLELDPQAGAVPGGVLVPRHATLLAPPVQHVRASFRTAYPIRLWPLRVDRVELVPSNRVAAGLPSHVRSAVRICLESACELSIPELQIDALRFFLPGEGGSVPPLYALLCQNPVGVFVQCGDQSIRLGAEHVRPIGFEPDEGLLEYPVSAHTGYRILQEYFAFPEKFQFVEVSGIDRLPPPATPSDGPRELHISVLLEDSAAWHDLALAPEDVRLGCAPAVNLFRHRSEPIHLTRTQSEYEVVPDARERGSFEVYSITRVSGKRSGSPGVREFYPFYALHHGEQGHGHASYWHSSRRPSLKKGRTSSEVFLTLLDSDFDFYSPEVDTLSIETLCTNADLPSLLEFGAATTRSGPLGQTRQDFEVLEASGISSVRCLRSPTQTLPAPVSAGSRWRIISHLAVNYLSISGDGGSARGLEALRELLVLYDFVNSPATRSRIHGLVGLDSKRIVRRIGRGTHAGFVRGVQVQLEFDPHQYTGAGAFLFASVLDRFLGLYTSVNAFSQTVAILRGREGVLKQWPPRSGRAIVL